MSADPQAPDCVSVPTCIGCGAMSRPGTCATGCTERKLVLVRAGTLDALTSAELRIQASVVALHAVVDELLKGRPLDEECSSAYATLQEHARAALRAAPDDPGVSGVLAEPAEPTITWWCDRCDGVDAPQPCLGICVWRSVDWARHDIYAELREQTISEYGAEQRLRRVLQRLAHTTPHPGRHEQAWHAFAEEAATATTPDRSD